MRQVALRRRGLVCFHGSVAEAAEAGQGHSPSGARARPRPKRGFVRRRCFHRPATAYKNSGVDKCNNIYWETTTEPV